MGTSRLLDRVLPWRQELPPLFGAQRDGHDDVEAAYRHAQEKRLLEMLDLADKSGKESLTGQLFRAWMELEGTTAEALGNAIEKRGLARSLEKVGREGSAKLAAKAASAAGKEEEKERDDVVSLGDIFSDPLGATGKMYALDNVSEDELIDKLAENIEHFFKVMALTDKVTGGNSSKAAALGLLDDARREQVQRTVSSWRKWRIEKSGGSAGTETEEASLMDDSADEDIQIKVMKRLEEREREAAAAAAREKLKKRSFAADESKDSGGGGVARRWPLNDGPLRQWKVPLLIGIEGAGLAALALSTHSVLAAAVAQGVGLFALAVVESKEKKGKGSGGAASA